MRSEQEMLDLIINTAREDERIRAALLNGSRANPNARRDCFQDFDVIYFVREVQPFWKNLEWIRRFGELMILQMPEDMDDPPADRDGHFSYLMQFKDGNRIDLGIDPLEKCAECASDSLSVVLLDKDGLLDSVQGASEKDYLPKPPTQKAFSDCCNEFWWVSAYVAKGLWREEILYAKHMAEQHVRPELMKMLKWHMGMRTGFAVNPGKFGKHYRRHMEPRMWEKLLQTYADANEEHTWEALLAMTDLFRELALAVAGHFGFEYASSDDENMTAHLRHVRALPRDAARIY